MANLKSAISNWQLAILLAFLPLIAYSQASEQDRVDRVMVIADPHVFSTDLFSPYAGSFTSMMESQRKMLDISEMVFNQLIDTALKYRPALVLIPGDLTKDGEEKSLQVVQEGIDRLREANIPTLFIPGNHDIGGTAYRYFGSEPQQLPEAEMVTDNNWPRTFFYLYDMPDFEIDVDKVIGEERSLSYSIQALPHLTVLAIDGSHEKAAQGSLSDGTLRFLLDRADSARAKGDMIIAMSHWQLIDHFDQKSTLEPSCRFANADAIRDSLMHHGVHLVLTGHFHVNSISTWRDTTGLTNDSIVELSTGSPITYPNPYRWLFITKDRTTVHVRTDYINDIEDQNIYRNTHWDFPSYSRDWMRVHTHNLIPTLARKAWGKVDAKWDSDIVPKLQTLGMGYLTDSLKKNLPQTDSARIAITDRHLGEPAVELYLFHSRANEHENMEIGQMYAGLVYDGMENMMDEVLGKYKFLGVLFKPLAVSMAQPVVESLVRNANLYNTDYESVTDDLHPVLMINSPVVEWGITSPSLQGRSGEASKVLRDGHLYLLRNGKTYTVTGQEIR